MTVQLTVAVANYFVGKAQQEGVGITPMKLLKLVYIAHGWHLGLYDQPLIGEEVQAWRYGPVVDSVYQDFKQYGRGNITRQHPTHVDGELSIPTVSEPNTQRFLDSVWNAYKHMDGMQLSALTHQPGTPWDHTWNGLGGRSERGAIIPQDVIRTHYQELSRARN